MPQSIHLGPGGLRAWMQVAQRAGLWPTAFTLRPYDDTWEATIVGARGLGDRVEVEVEGRWTAFRGGQRHIHGGRLRLTARRDGWRLWDWQIADDDMPLVARWAALTDHDELALSLVAVHGAWDAIHPPLVGIVWDGDVDLAARGAVGALAEALAPCGQLRLQGGQLTWDGHAVVEGAAGAWTVLRQPVDAFHAIDHVIVGTVTRVALSGRGKSAAVEVDVALEPGRRRATTPLVWVASDAESMTVRTPDGAEHVVAARAAAAAIANGRMARPEVSAAPSDPAPTPRQKRTPAPAAAPTDEAPPPARPHGRRKSAAKG